MQPSPRREPVILRPEFPAREPREAAPTPAANAATEAAWRLLRTVFAVLPLLTGLDKLFFHLINWEQYIAPVALRFLGARADLFMRAAGIGELVLGIGMIIRPAVFSFLIAIWLGTIVVNLLLTGAFYDIALRDCVLALSALATGILSFDRARRGRNSNP